MANTIQMNQFGMGPVQGQLDMVGLGSNVVSGLVDQSQSTNIVAGQAVKLLPASSGALKFVATTANTDKPFGFALYSAKNAIYSNAVNNGAIEVAATGSIVYLTAGAAISAQTDVENAFATNTVITFAGTNAIVGIALDAATASGQLIRVLVKTPAI